MPEGKINKQKDIKVINDPVEAVRKLPDVYIGALGGPGYLNMYREIVQNSLDEIMKGNTLDKNITISFDARNYTVIVEDNGQGIPLDMLAVVFSTLHSSSNYDKEEGSGEFSSGKNGLGATITNFLSRFFVVESYRMDGTAGKVEFEEGYLTTKGLQPIKCPNGKHGLITSFAPSEMMGEIDIDDVQIEQLTWKLVHLSSVGTKITLNIIDRNGTKRKSIIENKHGIFDMLPTICEKNLFEPIYFMQNNGTMYIECLVSYDIKNMDDPEIMSFVNTCPTNGGTHVDGFMDGFVRYLRDYMNKIFLANNNKLQVNAQDIKTGLRVIVNAKHLFPMFTGQSKEIFSSEDIKPYSTAVTLEALDEWSKKAPGDLQKLSKYLKDVCEIRMKQDGQKIKMQGAYTASAINDLPAKYKKPNGHKDLEVVLVEGDSAASGYENHRDKQTQGIMPLKGKILNACVTPTKKFFENEEVAGIFSIFGYKSYQSRFDPDKFRPSKVIIATDADADGFN